MKPLDGIEIPEGYAEVVRPREDTDPDAAALTAIWEAVTCADCRAAHDADSEPTVSSTREDES